MAAADDWPVVLEEAHRVTGRVARASACLEDVVFDLGALAGLKAPRTRAAGAVANELRSYGAVPGLPADALGAWCEEVSAALDGRNELVHGKLVRKFDGERLVPVVMPNRPGKPEQTVDLVAWRALEDRLWQLRARGGEFLRQLPRDPLVR